MTSKLRHKSELEKAREINILLLGETGSGKSTTLNALANYLKYSSFEEALQSLDNFTEVVSSQFTLSDKSSGQPRIIKSGPDDGERHGGGNSVTQAPFAYTFKFGAYTVRVIDTPGIGDTGGADEDDQNFDKIFQYLAHHEQLNAILIIVKGNETRKTTFFKYCLTELLTHLHKSVCENIMFCFTYTRNDEYGPGEGYITLQSFLDNDLAEANIKLTPKENCFFIDNEAFRFMVAKKQDFPFTKRQERSFRESWEESVKQIEDLFERIIALEPHELNKTISLNMAKKIIVDLAQPMIEIERTIKENIKSVKLQKSELKKTKKTKDILTRSLEIEVTEKQLVQLEKPINACTNSMCRNRIKINGEVRYPVCHQNCTCWFVTENMTGQKFIKFCKNFKMQKLGFGSTKCKMCGCSWSLHMHLTSEYRNVRRKLPDPEVQANIRTTEEMMDKCEKIILQIERLILEYTQEICLIKEIRTKFAWILNENSVFSYNKYFEQYLDFLIQTEKNKPEPNLSHLEEMKLDYQHNVEILREVIQKEGQKIQLEHVPELKKQLLQLKHTGQNFKQILDTKNAAAQSLISYSETSVIDLDTDKSLSRLFSIILRLLRFNFNRSYSMIKKN